MELFIDSGDVTEAVVELRSGIPSRARKCSAHHPRHPDEKRLERSYLSFLAKAFSRFSILFFSLSFDRFHS